VRALGHAIGQRLLVNGGVGASGPGRAVGAGRLGKVGRVRLEG